LGVRFLLQARQFHFAVAQFSCQFRIDNKTAFIRMEFAATLPVEERVRGLTTKVFLKRYAERYLPASIVYRRKRGLSVPLSANMPSGSSMVPVIFSPSCWIFAVGL
jgi:asparagine synthetase B (glutamine-hydrolysing)